MARTGKRSPVIAANSSSPSREPSASRSRKMNRLQDAVYREMFLLESKRPGADRSLAVALLRAVIEAEQTGNRQEFDRWLKSVCPRCLKMIEGASKDTSALPHSESLPKQPPRETIGQRLNQR